MASTRRRNTMLASLTLAAIVSLTGCATIRQLQAGDTGQLLAAAGFKMHLADTAERQQHLAALPSYRLSSRTRDGAVEYTYADPKNCKCVYVGGPQEYAQYRDLAARRQMAREQLWAAEDQWLGWGWGSAWWGVGWGPGWSRW